MRAVIENVQYVTGAPNADGDDANAFVRTPLFVAHVNFKQSDLRPDGSNWGDAEVIAEVQRKMHLNPEYLGITFMVEMPVKPIFPAQPFPPPAPEIVSAPAVPEVIGEVVPPA